MIVVTPIPRLFGADAITVWPFICVTPDWADDKPLMEHELVHYREQSKGRVLWWWIRYISPSFRFNAEVRGHAAQIAHGGCTIDWAAQYIVNTYKTGRSVEQAYEALTKELNK